MRIVYIGPKVCLGSSVFPFRKLTAFIPAWVAPLSLLNTLFHLLHFVCKVFRQWCAGTAVLSDTWKDFGSGEQAEREREREREREGVPADPDRFVTIEAAVNPCKSSEGMES
jgi:hypothetical protein